MRNECEFYPLWTRPTATLRTLCLLCWLRLSWTPPKICWLKRHRRRWRKNKREADELMIMTPPACTRVFSEFTDSSEAASSSSTSSLCSYYRTLNLSSIVFATAAGRQASGGRWYVNLSLTLSLSQPWQRIPIPTHTRIKRSFLSPRGCEPHKHGFRSLSLSLSSPSLFPLFFLSFLLFACSGPPQSGLSKGRRPVLAAPTYPVYSFEVRGAGIQYQTRYFSETLGTTRFTINLD